MKKSLLILSLLFASIFMHAQQPEDYFITIWNVPNYGRVTIPINPAFSYNYTVDWGDSTPVTIHTGTAVHDYGPVGGVFTIKISGIFPQFYNNGQWNTSLLSIEQWGNIQWKSMARSFKTVQNMAINTTDNPDLSQVTDMSEMFFQSGEFNGNMSGWDVSNVTNMSKMFFQCEKFNQDIGNWNVSNVTDMSHMFERTPFNQDISNWNVSSVTTMASMFSENVVFNQDLGRWNINNVTTMYNMFNGNAGALSPANYDALLRGWSTLSLPNSIDFNQPLLKYCTAGAARAIMEQKGWIFNDGGTDCLGGCTIETKWNGTSWTEGSPDNTKKVVLVADYNTATSGSIDACSIQINPGFTLTVAPGTTIKVQRDLAINGNLIFESSASGDGMLAQLGPKAAIVGNATVHRYMLPKRSYRIVSSPVTTLTSILENWQEGVHNTSTTENLNPNPGYGTHITGSTSGASGFDATGTGNPSMFTVDTRTQQFVAIENTDINKIFAGNSYLLMVRGDRSINLNINNPQPTQTILRAKGKLLFGQKHEKFASPSAGAFVMFGNPYQSYLDINTVFATSTNVNRNFYYVYDPNLGEKGSYVTVMLPGGTNSAGSVANQYLQPGQGGQFATNTAGIVTLDFLETDKVVDQRTSTNATGETMLADGELIVQLFTQDKYYNGGSVHDSFGIFFADGYSNGVTPEDALKPMNFEENIGINNNGSLLSVEKRALPEPGENFPLYSNGYQNLDYVLKMTLNGLNNVSFYLDDNFTGTSTLFEQGSIAHPFSVDPSSPESKATDRFSIRVAERLSVEENILASEIALYPNPMGGQLYVGNPKNIQLNSVSIYDITGRLIKNMDLQGATSEVAVDVSSLSSATYMVVINSEMGQLSKLIVKE